MGFVAIIGTIIVMFGIILIYDARRIAKKIFSFGEQNEATGVLKKFGFIISIIGSCLILFV